jgi:hypothetical protein
MTSWAFIRYKQLIPLPMTHYTPVINVSETAQMKREAAGPRPETLDIIRVFARIYSPTPNARTQQYRNFYLN